LVLVVIRVNEYIRPDFDINKYIDGGHQIFVAITAGLVLVGIAMITIVGHELSHACIYKLCTKKKPQFGCRNFNPYAALALRAYLKKWEAVLASLSPLIILTLLPFLLWARVPVEVLPYVLAIGIINGGLSTADMMSAISFTIKNKEVLIGYDGDSGAIYIPDK
jgi:hypothetical protein